MSKPTPARPVFDEADRPRDWFLPAIEAEGSVAECLDAVLGQLDARAAFVAALRTALAAPPGTTPHKNAPDAVTDLAHRIKALENTLRFRLGILRPERPLAWFRAPAATSTGPFATTLIDEPVFQAYDPQDADKVRRDLANLWTRRVRGPLPFKDDGPSLWKTLLTFNADLEQLAAMPAPFQALRLDKLPDDLPRALESRPLRAFLVNVRTEVLGTRERLQACHKQLLEACERFWSAQKDEDAKERFQARPRPSANPAADSMREEFKRRRQAATKPPVTSTDRDALRYMGFDDVPSPETLRQRYLEMAKRLHPDRRGGRDLEFKELNNAYSHLAARLER